MATLEVLENPDGYLSVVQKKTILGSFLIVKLVRQGIGFVSYAK